MAENVKKIEMLDLLTSLRKTTQRLKTVLCDAESAAQGSASDFVNNSIGILIQAVEIYQNCFAELGIKTRKELELAWQKMFSVGEIQDEVEELLAVEDQWNSFLRHTDEQLDWNAETNKVLADFSNCKTQIFVISFGCVEGAKHWKEETGCSFEVLVDEARAIYTGFGLTKSVFKVWNTNSMLYYAEQLAANKALPKKFGDFEDDVHQMGGDFILNAEGMVVLAHVSQTPVDRPSLDTLLEAAKACSLQE